MLRCTPQALGRRATAPSERQGPARGLGTAQGCPSRWGVRNGGGWKTSSDESPRKPRLTLRACHCRHDRCALLASWTAGDAEAAEALEEAAEWDGDPWWLCAAAAGKAAATASLHAPTALLFAWTLRCRSKAGAAAAAAGTAAAPAAATPTAAPAATAASPKASRSQCASAMCDKLRSSVLESPAACASASASGGAAAPPPPAAAKQEDIWSHLYPSHYTHQRFRLSPIQVLSRCWRLAAWPLLGEAGLWLAWCAPLGATGRAPAERVLGAVLAAAGCALLGWLCHNREAHKRLHLMLLGLDTKRRDKAGCLPSPPTPRVRPCSACRLPVHQRDEASCVAPSPWPWSTTCPPPLRVS